MAAAYDRNSIIQMYVSACRGPESSSLKSPSACPRSRRASPRRVAHGVELGGLELEDLNEAQVLLLPGLKGHCRLHDKPITQAGQPPRSVLGDRTRAGWPTRALRCEPIDDPVRQTQSTKSSFDLHLGRSAGFTSAATPVQLVLRWLSLG
jgi:hypothetical protein